MSFQHVVVEEYTVKQSIKGTIFFLWRVQNKLSWTPLLASTNPATFNLCHSFQCVLKFLLHSNFFSWRKFICIMATARRGKKNSSQKSVDDKNLAMPKSDVILQQFVVWDNFVRQICFIKRATPTKFCDQGTLNVIGKIHTCS